MYVCTRTLPHIHWLAIRRACASLILLYDHSGVDGLMVDGHEFLCAAAGQSSGNFVRDDKESGSELLESSANIFTIITYGCTYVHTYRVHICQLFLNTYLLDHWECNVRYRRVIVGGGVSCASSILLILLKQQCMQRVQTAEHTVMIIWSRSSN